MLGHNEKFGKQRTRRSYSRISEVLELPNLIEIQTDSYKWFLETGIKEMFKDITPMLADAGAFAAAVEAMATPWRGSGIAAVMAIEARGFLLGAPLALALGASLVPVRKPGRLPGRLLEQPYALEYGHDTLQVQANAVAPGTRVLLVDDVLATGGTLMASRALAERLDATIVGAGVLLEIKALEARTRWGSAIPLHSTLVA